jgi:hypothetical protein
MYYHALCLGGDVVLPFPIRVAVQRVVRLGAGDADPPIVCPFRRDNYQSLPDHLLSTVQSSTGAFIGGIHLIPPDFSPLTVENASSDHAR